MATKKIAGYEVVRLNKNGVKSVTIRTFLIDTESGATANKQRKEANKAMSENEKANAFKLKKNGESLRVDKIY